MPVKERISLRGGIGRSSRTFKLVCIALICVLAIGLGTLSVYTVLTVGEQRRVTAEQATALSDTRSQLAQVQGELQQKQQELQKKQEELAQAQKDASSAITEKDNKIGEQEKTISDLNGKIADLEKQVALKRQEQAQLQGGQTPTTPTVSQPSVSVDTYKDKKIVALTFDDGPGPYTARLLDILKERQVPATFFVLGTRVDSYPEIIKRMGAEGHEIGNHSNSHKNLQAMSTIGQIKTEMDLCANKIHKLLGRYPTVMRCPYGSMDSEVKAYAKGAGVPLIQWDVDTRDWESRNVNAILNKTFSGGGLSDGSIVLLHDIHKSTVDAIPTLIDRFKQKGYTFVTVSQLLQARCGGIEAGKVYYEG